MSSTADSIITSTDETTVTGNVDLFDSAKAHTEPSIHPSTNVYSHARTSGSASDQGLRGRTRGDGDEEIGKRGRRRRSYCGGGGMGVGRRSLSLKLKARLKDVSKAPTTAA